MPITKITGSIWKKLISDSDNGLFLPVCHITHSSHSSDCPAATLYSGHKRGIMTTGINQIPRVLSLFPQLKNTRVPVSGIIVKAGTFVYIAKPRKIPERRTKVPSLILDLLPVDFVRLWLWFGPKYAANKIEDNMKGIKIVSK
jgi:hypothetical protein